MCHIIHDSIFLEKQMNNKLTTVHIHDKRIYFSYATPIAFWDGNELYVSENDWGRTTGKHLNYIDDGNKEDRIPHKDFMEILKQNRFENTHHEIITTHTIKHYRKGN